MDRESLILENLRLVHSCCQRFKGKGFEYFVIDCGWYKADGVPWDISMGDYVPSRTLFAEGLEKTTEAIREAGMKPGIWFEIENIGPAADATLYLRMQMQQNPLLLRHESSLRWAMIGNVQ